MTQQWKTPPLNKIYEALGAIGDKRIEIDGNSAKVYSSSRNKYYDVEYDASTNTISSNDNASFYVGYLGYPGIAFLLAKGVIAYDHKLADYLSGFAWKDINRKFKNDFDKTDAYIDQLIVEKHHIDIKDFHAQLQHLLTLVTDMQLNKPATGKRPPVGY